MKVILVLAMLIAQVSQAQTRFYEAESAWTQRICNYPRSVPDPYDPNPPPRHKPLSETALDDACDDSLSKCYVEFNKEFPDTEFRCEEKNRKIKAAETIYDNNGEKYCKYVYKVNASCLTQAIAK